MKKVFSITISLMIIILSIVSVSASGDTYVIDEIGISVNIPSGYVAITRDTPYDDTLGFTKEEFDSTFEENDVYLVAFPKLYGAEQMILCSNDINIRSLSDFSDSELKEFAESDLEVYYEEGYEVSGYQIFDSHNATYIVTSFSDSNGDYAIHYWTIENYKTVNITCWCFGKEPTVNQKQIFLSFVNGITFDTEDEKFEPDDATNATSPLYGNENIQIYEKTFTLSIAENGRLTPLGESLILTGVIVLIQIIAGVVVLVILLNKRKKRRKAALAQTDITTQPISDSPVQPALKTKFCIYCGTKLTENDSFCHVCGKNQNINSQ